MRAQYISVRRAAETYDLHPCTVRRWIKSGALRAVVIGKRNVRVRIEDLHALMREKEAA